MTFKVSMKVAVDRLNSKVKRFDLPPLKSNGMVGSVKADRVTIYRSTIMNNSFRPVFIGYFEHGMEGTKLYGKFQMHRYVQIFMTLWIVGVLAFPVLMTIIGVGETGDVLISFLAGLFFGMVSLLLVGFLLGLLKFCEWLSSDDIDWLKREIGDAIHV